MADEPEDEIELSPNLEALSEAYAEDPTSKKFLPLAEEYRKSRMYDEAIYICKEGLKHHPDFIPALLTLARCLIDVKSYDDATATLESVIEKQSENPTAHQLLGRLSMKRGDFDSAKEHFLAVLQTRPEDEEAKKRLREIDLPEDGRPDIVDLTPAGLDEREFVQEPDSGTSVRPPVEIAGTHEDDLLSEGAEEQIISVGGAQDISIPLHGSATQDDELIDLDLDDSAEEEVSQELEISLGDVDLSIGTDRSSEEAAAESLEMIKDKIESPDYNNEEPLETLLELEETSSPETSETLEVDARAEVSPTREKIETEQLFEEREPGEDMQDEKVHEEKEAESALGISEDTELEPSAASDETALTEEEEFEGEELSVEGESAPDFLAGEPLETSPEEEGEPLVVDTETVVQPEDAAGLIDLQDSDERIDDIVEKELEAVDEIAPVEADGGRLSSNETVKIIQAQVLEMDSVSREDIERLQGDVLYLDKYQIFIEGRDIKKVHPAEEYDEESRKESFDDEDLVFELSESIVSDESVEELEIDVESEAEVEEKQPEAYSKEADGIIEAPLETVDDIEEVSLEEMAIQSQIETAAESMPTMDQEHTETGVQEDIASAEIAEEVAPPTITSARIYEEQGHLREALGIYQKLQEANPYDEEISNKIAELQSRISAQPSYSSVQVEILQRWLRNIELFREKMQAGGTSL